MVAVIGVAVTWKYQGLSLLKTISLTESGGKS